MMPERHKTVEAPVKQRWESINDVLERLPISKTHLYRLIRNGDIPATKLGRKILLQEGAIEKVMGMPITSLANDLAIAELDKRLSDIENSITEISKMLAEKER